MDWPGQPLEHPTSGGQAALLVRVLLTAVLALGVLLPAVDHHFAERVPWHQHLLSGRMVSSSVAHAHAHEHPHEHGPSGTLLTAHSFDPALHPGVSIVPFTATEAVVWAVRGPVLPGDMTVGAWYAGVQHRVPSAPELAPEGRAIPPDPPPPVLPS